MNNYKRIDKLDPVKKMNSDRITADVAMAQIEDKRRVFISSEKKNRSMPRTARTPVKGNAYDCKTDKPGTKKKTPNSSKERYDEVNRVCTADSRKTCRTCWLKVVIEVKEMGIECDVCRRGFHAKCEKITEEEYKFLDVWNLQRPRLW